MKPAYPFHHGRVSLSFVGTVGDRGSAAIERLETAAALGEWLRAASLLQSRDVPTSARYRQALKLRESIANIVRALTGATTPRRADVDTLNDFAGKFCCVPCLDPATLRSDSGAREAIERALGTIAADAIAMIADSTERDRLRTCASDSCGAIFLTPVGGRERRWCSMARCGNRDKVAAFRARACGAEPPS